MQETVRKASSEHILQESVDVGGSGSGGGKPVAARALIASNVSETDYAVDVISTIIAAACSVGNVCN